MKNKRPDEFYLDGDKFCVRLNGRVSNIRSIIPIYYLREYPLKEYIVARKNLLQIPYESVPEDCRKNYLKILLVQ